MFWLSNIDCGVILCVCRVVSVCSMSDMVMVMSVCYCNHWSVHSVSVQEAVKLRQYLWPLCVCTCLSPPSPLSCDRTLRHTSTVHTSTPGQSMLEHLAVLLSHKANNYNLSTVYSSCHLWSSLGFHSNVIQVQVGFKVKNWFVSKYVCMW